MRIIKSLGMAFASLLVVFAIVTTTATAALPQIIPTTTELEINSVGNFSLVALPGGAANTVTCAKLHGLLGFTAEAGRKGPATWDCEGAIATILGITVKCTGEGESEGVILVKGEAHLVFDSLSPLGVAALFLVSPDVKYACAGTRVRVLGSVLCLFSTINARVTEVRVKCEGSTISGDQAETTWWNDKGEAQKAELLTSKPESEPEKDSAIIGEAVLKSTTGSFEIIG